MNNERFMVPEILFRPSDIGIQQVRHEVFHLIGDKIFGDKILTKLTRWVSLKLL